MKHMEAHVEDSTGDEHLVPCCVRPVVAAPLVVAACTVVKCVGRSSVAAELRLCRVGAPVNTGHTSHTGALMHIIFSRKAQAGKANIWGFNASLCLCCCLLLLSPGSTQHKGRVRSDCTLYPRTGQSACHECEMCTTGSTQKRFMGLG